VSKPPVSAAPYLSLTFTDATNIAEIFALVRAALAEVAPPCECGTSPALMVTTTAGMGIDVTHALAMAEIALRSGNLDRLSTDVVEDAVEFVHDRAASYATNVANTLRARLARNKDTRNLAVRSGFVVSTEGAAVAVVGIGYPESEDKITLVSAVELAEVLHHFAPRERGTTLLDTIATEVEAFNPTELACEEEVRFACEGDTIHTVYVGWDDEEFYRNEVVVEDDTAGQVIYVQLGPVVGEA
jgi:hypothetical protein